MDDIRYTNACLDDTAGGDFELSSWLLLFSLVTDAPLILGWRFNLWICRFALRLLFVRVLVVRKVNSAAGLGMWCKQFVLGTWKLNPATACIRAHKKRVMQAYEEGRFIVDCLIRYVCYSFPCDWMKNNDCDDVAVFSHKSNFRKIICCFRNPQPI